MKSADGRVTRMLSTTSLSLRTAVLAFVATATFVCVAQTPPPSTPPARSAIPSAEILPRADQDQRQVERLMRRLAAPGATEQLLRKLEQIEQPIDDKLRDFPAGSLRRLPVMRLESLARHWSFDARRFADWQAEMRRDLGSFDEAAAQLAQRRAVWEATRAAMVAEPLPRILIERVDTLLTAHAAAEQALVAPLRRQIEVGRRANAVDARIEVGRSDVAAAIAAIDRRLLQMDSPPLWDAGRDSLAEPQAQDSIARGLEIETRFARDYASAATGHQRSLLVIQILLLVLLLALRFRTRLTSSGPTDPVSTRVIHRPVSTWILLSMMAVLALEPDAPLLTQEIAMLVALVPLLRVMPRQHHPALKVWPYIAAAFYVVDRLAVVFMASGFLFRVFQLGLTCLALALTLSLLLRWQRHGNAVPPAPRLVGWAAVVLLATATLANLLGNVSLAETLASGVTEAGYFALMLYAAVGVSRALLRALLGEARVWRIPLLSQHVAPLLEVLSRGLVLAAVIGWLAYTMNSFRLLRPVQAWSSAVLGHNFEVGELSVSLGGVLVFAVSVLVSWWSARIVRRVLDEQLSARPSLPRGIASSVASLSFYGVLILGFLVALSAAGFKVSQLTLIFGALGVGIGFGLQNFVNNFVSGLVLMFERPLRPGDIVDVAGTSGQVREIRMRATIIRTFDGADVVVPNGSLLAGSLTNWTLLDRARRIELQVGVAYGSDPRQVVALLETTARSVVGVEAEPAPSAQFSNYGDSSLDFVLRAWTTDFDRWGSIRSELMIRILGALVDAGIEIPFRQVDVNLHSLAPEASDGPRTAPR